MCRLPQALFRASPHGRLTGCAAAQCGKLALLDRILTRLHRDGRARRQPLRGGRRCGQPTGAPARLPLLVALECKACKA